MMGKHFVKDSSRQLTNCIQRKLASMFALCEFKKPEVLCTESSDLLRIPRHHEVLRLRYSAPCR